MAVNNGVVTGQADASGSVPAVPAVPPVDPNPSASTPGGVSGSVDYANVAFTTVIDLSSNKKYADTTVSGAIAFTVAGTPKVGAQGLLRLTANGIDVPNFGVFRELSGSSGYSNIANIVNNICFGYDGTDYIFSVNQRIGDMGLTDTVPPNFTAAVANATPTVINLTSNEPINQPTSDTTVFSVSGIASNPTISSVTWVDSTRVNVTLSAAIVSTDTPLLNFTQSGLVANQYRDLAGNLVANFTNRAVTNNVQPPSAFVSVRFTTANVGGPTTGTYTETGDFTNGFTYSSTATGSATRTGAVIDDPVDTGSLTLPASIQGNGKFRVNYVAGTANDGALLLLGTSANLSNINTAEALVGLGVNGSNQYSRYDGNASAFTAIAGSVGALANDEWETVRVGSTITANVYRQGASTPVFSYTFSTTSSADLFPVIRRSNTATVNGQIWSNPRIER